MKKIFTIAALIMFLGAGEILAQFTYTYTGKPRFQIVTKQNNAVLGIINIELFPRIAPLQVRNFDSLVSVKFFDTIAFHRCVPGFVIQGGDPNSRHGAYTTWGYGQPGQPMVNAEFSVAKHVRGSFSAARSSNINSATSQFFICVAATPNLNGSYSLYGHVTSGMSVADAIVNTPKLMPPPSTYSSMPAQKIEMFVTYIGSNDTIPPAPALVVPKNDSIDVDTASVLLKWNPVNDVIYYQLQIAKDAAFTDSVAYLNTTGTSYFLRHMDQYTTYYWRVLTNNGGNLSPYTPTWKFYTHFDWTSIKTPGSSSSSTDVFPNPGSGNFTFNKLEKGNKIEVFDATGKLISTSIVNDVSFNLNLEGKEKGLYVYRISSPQKKTVEGKLIIR